MKSRLILRAGLLVMMATMGLTAAQAQNDDKYPPFGLFEAARAIRPAVPHLSCSRASPSATGPYSNCRSVRSTAANSPPFRAMRLQRGGMQARAQPGATGDRGWKHPDGERLPHSLGAQRYAGGALHPWRVFDFGRDWRLQESAGRRRQHLV